MEDQCIVDMFLHRSEQAISSMASKYGSICKSIAYHIVGNEQDAEECVNDAYLAVWNTIPPQIPSSFPAYLCKITRNISLKKYRSNTAAKRNCSYDVSLDELCECLSSTESVEHLIQAEELARQINYFLHSLNRKDRVIFMQRYWFCKDISEIAEHMNTNKNYITVRLHRIREKLKKYLEQEELL